VWDLDNTSSICPSCTQGCNIKVDTRDNLVTRLRPRHNAHVNSYWMCDHGRRNYDWLNRTDRVEVPLVRDETGRLIAANWQQAIRALVDRLGSVRGRDATIVGSPYQANEDNGLLARLAEVLGAGSMLFRSPRAEDEVPCPGFAKLARRRDLAANVRGLEELGFSRVGDDEAAGGLATAPGAVLIVLADELVDAPPEFGADAALFVVLGHALSRAARNAHFILPVTTFAEQEGTFTNFERRVQRFWPALQPPPLARPAWQVLGVLLAGLDDGPAPADAASAFLRLGSWSDPFRGLSYEMLGARGALLNEPVRLAGAGREN
ncbi:MAG: molybdopterin-dependent oxidoreductase, partial [Longimicrobiales bacterium]